MADFIDDDNERNILLHIFLEDLFFYFVLQWSTSSTIIRNEIFYCIFFLFFYFILMDKKIQIYFTVFVYDFMTLKGECCKPFILITYSHYLLVNLKILFRFFKNICRGKTANRCGKLKFSSLRRQFFCRRIPR